MLYDVVHGDFGQGTFHELLLLASITPVSYIGSVYRTVNQTDTACVPFNGKATRWMSSGPTATKESIVGKKLNKVYEALLDGAANGLTDQKLYDFVLEKCPKTSSKRIVKASLFALSDPDVRDRDVLEAIYALAITYRLSALGVEEDVPEDDDDDAGAPSISADLKSKLESSTSDLPALVSADQDQSDKSDRSVH